MVNTNLFELSSSFGSASGGGTLAYPNLSLVEENNEIHMHTELPLIIWYAFNNFDDRGLTAYAIEGMTWGQWLNSSYNNGIDIYNSTNGLTHYEFETETISDNTYICVQHDDIKQYICYDEPVTIDDIIIDRNVGYYGHPYTISTYEINA